MQRSTIGGIAAGGFVLGILAGILVPAALAQGNRALWMDDRITAPYSMHGVDSMPMRQMGSMMRGSMPMGPVSRLRVDHMAHHAPTELPQ